MRKERQADGWLFWKEGHEDTPQEVHVPHDAMLTEIRQPELENGSASGFFPGGKYFYRKELTVTAEDMNETWILEFEGIYMDSRVFLNGEAVGGHYYGYTNFFVDITEKRKIGRNELLVVADNSKTPNSRWYSGSGIYRPVNLYRSGRTYIVPDGVQIQTVSLNPAVLHITFEAVMTEQQTVSVKIMRDGRTVQSAENMQAIPIDSRNPQQGDKTGTADRKCFVLNDITVPNAAYWSHEHPDLYRITVELTENHRVADAVTIPYGIRQLNWDSMHGFQVNGETVKLKGGCVHHDNGPLGAATNDKAEYRKISKMKALGYNAIRYSHNPAGKNFLRICDELGMYVIDETFDQWKLPQSTYDYATHFDEEWEKDLTALVRKDFNHPSVIMYCVGNEITDTGLPHGAAVCKMLCTKIKEMDSSRPTLLAINSMLSVLARKQYEKKMAEAAMTEEERKAQEEKNVGSKDVNDIITLLPKIMASITPESLEALIHEVVECVDIVGYNYGENLYAGTHELAPQRVILSSETFPARIGEHWPNVLSAPYVIGDFMWTAWDYLGEAGVGLPFYGSEQAPFSKSYPCLTAGCGSIDLTGYTESQGRYTSVIFGTEKKPCIAVRPVNHSGEPYTVGKWRLTDAVDSWTWDGYEGKTAEIEVYSIGAEVELWQSICGGAPVMIDRKELTQCRASFTTEYQPGKLLAVSFDAEGNEIERSELISGDPDSMQLQIQPEEDSIHGDGEDLLYVNITITDMHGVPHILRDQKITVTVEGAGELIALASANPETEEYFSDKDHTSYHGRLLAIVRPKKETGSIRIKAKAGELYAEASIPVI